MKFVYRNYDMQEIGAVIKRGIGYEWILLSLLIGLLSHFSRTIRWQMLIEPAEKKTRITNTFLAVMVGYFGNLIMPRMGEISRCGVVSQYEGVSVSRLIGTVVAERLIDLVTLIFFFVLIIYLQFDVVSESMSSSVDVGKINGVFHSYWTYVFLLIFVVVFIYARRLIIKSSLYFKLIELWCKFKEGFGAIKNIKNKPVFLIHTLFIWAMYFLMIYVCFFAFDFTTDLKPLTGLVVFVLGSVGMVVPVQGGMGAWHYLVIMSLSMYGVEKSEGAAFALIVWSSLNAMIVIVGVISVIILPIINKKKI